MKKGVLFVIGDLDVGGAERHLVQVLPVLEKKGIKATVYTITHKGHLAAILEKAGVPVVQPFFAGRIRKLPRALRKIVILPLSTVALCRELYKGYAVVHFFLPAAYLFGGLASLFCPKRVLVMSRRSLNLYQTQNTVLSLLERWLHGKMDAVLGNSRAVQADLEHEGVMKDRLGLIYNGIEPTAYRSAGGTRDFRATLDVSENALVYVIVANLIVYKGHADLISAFQMASESLPAEWVVLVIGKDCGIEAELKEQAEEAGVSANIRWLGLRDDIPDLLAAADVGIICSHQEGFSNSLLEYMATGLPVIATDVGGNKEAVVDCETGIVVQPHNPTELGKAIVKMSANYDVRVAMGRAGKARFQENFTLDVCASRYENLYRGLLSGVPTTVQDMIDGCARDVVEVKRPITCADL